MSEEKKVYRAGPGDIVPLLEQSGALCEFGDNYRQPTPEQIKALRTYLGLSQIAFAKLVGVTYKEGKGSQTIRKWETPEGQTEHRKIPYSAWRLLLIAAGLIEPPYIEK